MLSQYDIAVALPASDLERARDFYEKTLGFEPEVGEGGTTYRSGNAALFLYPSQFAGTNKATAAAWGVEDIEDVVDGLREKGVTFEEYDFEGLTTENGIATLGDGTRSAWFTDTEGNILAVTQSDG